MWSIQVSYKLHVLAWLVIYEGLPIEVHLVRSGISDGFFPLCLKLETVKHLFWDCPFARSCWKFVESEDSTFLHGKFHWRATLLGDSNSLAHHSL